MISYNLRCENFHEFSGWFSSSADFDRQQENGLLTCPVCSSERVEKSLMAPAIATSRSKQERREQAGGGEQGGQQIAIANQAAMPAMPPEMVEKLKQFKRTVLANSEDVGERFAEEARKIHYGESEARGVHGKANLHEAVALAEEGIAVLPLPELPDEKN